MYDRILVPTDGSPGADAVLDHAAALASVHDTEVHAMYVISTAGYTSLPTDAGIEGLGPLLADQGEKALDRAEEHIEDVERVLVEGSPGEEIVAYADSEGCDLIVMGTHGRGGIDRLLLGVLPNGSSELLKHPCSRCVSAMANRKTTTKPV